MTQPGKPVSSESYLKSFSGPRLQPCRGDEQIFKTLIFQAGTSHYNLKGSYMRRRMVFLSMGLLFLGTSLSACHQLRPSDPAGETAAPITQPGQSRAAARHAALGNDYYQRHRSSEALAEWRLALALDPARRDVAEKISRLENSGTAASRSVGNSLNADEDLGRRIALTLNQADKYYQASQLKEADLAYNEILQLDPANGFAQKGLAQLAAETYAADTQRPYDQLTANLYQEGMGFYRKKEWAQSMAKLQEAAKLNPEQPQVKKFLDLSLAEAARQRDMVRERQLVEQAQSAEAAHAWLPAYAAWQEAANLVPPPAEAAAGVQRTGR
jgi:tetratricopeptide (TPR) repeat protein